MQYPVVTRRKACLRITAVVGIIESTIDNWIDNWIYRGKGFFPLDWNYTINVIISAVWAYYCCEAFMYCLLQAQGRCTVTLDS